ncbi:MAG: carboxypeptidase-like regulatory domain-containing protein [Chloroflexota bacterium]
MFNSIIDLFIKTPNDQKLSRNNWVNYLLILTILASSSFVTTASNIYRITLSVYVYDCSSKIPISGAHVESPTADNGSNSQGYTDSNGYVQLYIKPGDRNHSIRVSANGYHSKTYSQYFKSNSSPSVSICIEPQGPPPTKEIIPTGTPTCSLPKPNNDEIENAIDIEEGLATKDTNIYSIQSTYGTEQSLPYMSTSLTSTVDLSAATTNQNDPVITPPGLSESKYYHSIWYKVLNNKDNALNSIDVKARFTLPYGGIQNGIICFYYSSDDSTPFNNVDCQIGEANLTKEATSPSKAVVIEIVSETQLDPCSKADISIQAKYKKEEQKICPNSSPASNDKAKDAKQINREQWQDKVTLESASVEANELTVNIKSGMSAVDKGKGYHSVWYRYKPEACPPSKTADIKITANLQDEKGAKLSMDTLVCVSRDLKTSLTCGFNQASVVDIKTGLEYYIKVASKDETLQPCTGMNFTLSKTCQNRPDDGKSPLICIDGLRKDVKSPCELMLSAGVTSLFSRFLEVYLDCKDSNCRKQQLDKFFNNLANYSVKATGVCLSGNVSDQLGDTIFGKSYQKISSLKGKAELYDWIEEVGRYIDKNPHCKLLSDLVKVTISNFSQKGLPFYYFKVNSPVNLLLTDKQGRRVGFLVDGTIVAEIPDVRVFEENGNKVIFFTSFDPIKSQLNGISDGIFTLNMINPKGQTVQDVSFVDVPVTSRSIGEIDLSKAKPVIKIDREGNDNIETLQPDSYTEYPVEQDSPISDGQVNVFSITPSLWSSIIGWIALLLAIIVVVLFIYIFTHRKKG